MSTRLFIVGLFIIATICHGQVTKETLWNAIESGNTNAVTQYLMHGGNANIKDASGTPAIVKAAKFGHADIVQLLLLASADPNAKDLGGNTALSVAVGANYAAITNALHEGKSQLQEAQTHLQTLKNSIARKDYRSVTINIERYQKLASVYPEFKTLLQKATTDAETAYKAALPKLSRVAASAVATEYGIPPERVAAAIQSEEINAVAHVQKETASGNLDEALISLNSEWIAPQQSDALKIAIESKQEESRSILKRIPTTSTNSVEDAKSALRICEAARLVWKQNPNLKLYEGYLQHYVQAQNISLYIGDALEYSSQPSVWSIITLNVMGYYNLENTYDTDLKKQVFNKSDEYKEKLSVLTKIKSELQSKTFFLKLSESFSDKPYNISRKTFTYCIGNNYISSSDDPRPPKSIHGILFEMLPVEMKSSEVIPNGLSEYLLLNINEEGAVAIENNAKNCFLYVVFTLENTIRNVNFKCVNMFTNGAGDWCDRSDTMLIAKSARIIVSDSTGRIYYNMEYPSKTR